MKIKPSLRLYFFVAMLLSGTISIAVMTGVGLNYFFSGLELSMRVSLMSQATEIELIDNKPRQLADLTIAAKWEDLPQVIQDNFQYSQLEDNQMLKLIDGLPIIDEPEFGYFTMRVVNKGKVRYVALVLEKDIKQPAFEQDALPPFFYIVIIGSGVMVFFALVVYAVQRKMSTPVEKLRSWAKGLKKEQLTQPPPNFHYSELNSLAELIRSSLSSVQEGLEREQRFLGYASHELRTPIAVTRTNSELLRKMITKGIEKDKQIEVLDRIERAGFTMTDLTETLLWLNRQEEKLLPSKTLQIGELIKQVESELHYLLQGKSVEVSVSVDDTEIELPESLCRIVLTNLIRNAFQHTHDGAVKITQVGSQFSILNRNNDAQIEQDDLGFGLGLELTKRLISQHGWLCHFTQGEGVWEVEVVFESIG